MANSKDTTIKTFEFKLRTNKCFVEACERELEHSRQIYNAALEDLNIRGMVRNRHLAQAISDVAWGRFFKMTKSKAENAGRTFERVDPRYTSQICSGCGHRQRMPLAMRIFECGKCGIVIGRDHNAAIIIDRAGQAQITTPVEKRDSDSKKRERVGRTQLEPQRGGN